MITIIELALSLIFGLCLFGFGAAIDKGDNVLAVFYLLVAMVTLIERYSPKRNR